MPTPVIDLFAGPGGLNEGFSCIRDARGRPVFRTATSVEFESTAHRTLELRALFRHLREAGDTDNYYRYLRDEITREELFDRSLDLGKAAQDEALLAELGRSEADNRGIEERISAALKKLGGGDCVLIGGPPCQAYSLVGRARRTNDENFELDHKHFLYREYLNIVRRFRPAVFVMENVPGLLSASNRGVRMFELICSDLRRQGYTLHSMSTEGGGDDPRRFVVHAEEFGVPQCRSRVFILGLRADLNLRPMPLARPEGKPVTVADVLGDLPRIRSRISREPDSVQNWRAAILQLGKYRFEHLEPRFHAALLERLDTIPVGYALGQRTVPRDRDGPERLSEWLVDAECGFITNHNSRGHMRSDLMRYFFWSAFAEHYDRSPTLSQVPHFLRPNHGNVSGDARSLPFGDRFRVQLRSRPATTVVSHISKDGHYYIHYEPKQCRSLSVREAARLQTFPDSYFFEGPATDQYRQVGNAVPPYLAMQIAKVVRDILSGRSTRKPAESVALSR